MSDNFKQNKLKNFTVIRNEIIDDKELSFKALGLAVFMLRLPPTWRYSIAGLSTVTGKSQSAIKTALKELEDKGYLKREQAVKDGKFSHMVYTISDKAKIENFTMAENTTALTTTARNDGLLNTKESNTNNISSSLRSEDIYGCDSGKSKKGNLHSNPSLRPTLEEVKAYIDEKGYSVDAKKFFNYFDEGEWIDGKGQPVRSWKQKIITWEQNNGNRKDTNFGTSKDKRTGVAERIERGFDDFPRFKEAGKT